MCFPISHQIVSLYSHTVVLLTAASLARCNVPWVVASQTTHTLLHLKKNLYPGSRFCGLFTMQHVTDLVNIEVNGVQMLFLKNLPPRQTSRRQGLLNTRGKNTVVILALKSSLQIILFYLCKVSSLSLFMLKYSPSSIQLNQYLFTLQ